MAARNNWLSSEAMKGQHRGSDHMTQRINEQIGALPAIESELHLFEVGREMLSTDSVPCPHDAALEKREGGFDSIGVNVTHDIYIRPMVNLFVIRPLSFPHGGIVRGCIVGEDYFHVLTDILADVLCQRSAFRISGMEEAEIAVALADADHYFFVFESNDVTFSFNFAADIGNVHLYFTIEHWLIGLRHCVPDAMAEIPSRLVAHSDRALNLAGRHSLFCFTEQVRREEPLAEWQVRIVEYGAGSDGELVVTIFAVEELFVGFQLDHGAFAAQALWPFGEAETNQKFAALIFGAEQCVYIN